MQLDAQEYETEQKNFVEDEPEMHQFVIFKGTQHSSVTGCMKRRQGSKTHDHHAHLDIGAEV